jgi:tRNA dimethylallyltransferase
VVRALEVAELTGRPLSAQQEQQALPVEMRPKHVYWLSPPRERLHARIDERVDRMMAAGLLEETKRLLSRPGGLGKTARQALGYRELIEHIEGDTTLNDAIRLIKLRTRQFAKRQHTWFRNLVECRPVDIHGGESAGEVVERILGSAEWEVRSAE